MQQKNIVVIGAGMSGLATAALLGKAGHTVTVLEKNEVIGGRAMVFREAGFTFDMGPSWYMMPELFERYFSLFGKQPSDFYLLKRLDPQFKAFYNTDEGFIMPGTLEGAIAAFETLDPGIAPRLYAHLESSKHLKQHALGELLYKSYNSMSTLFNPRLIFDASKLNLHTTLHSVVSKLSSNPRVMQLLEFHSLFLGCSPYNMPAFYSLMDYVLYNDGVFYPMGGIYKIIGALEKLCVEYRVAVKTGKSVKKIAVANAEAKSVITEDGDVYNADVVISSADYPFTETKLLDIQWQTYSTSYWEKKTIAPSAFIIYLGVKGKIKSLAHHSFYFANNWHAHFDSIYKTPNWPEDPSYYICTPSKTDASVVPDDCENIFIMVPVAPGLIDQDEVCAYFEKKILTHFSKLIGEPLDGRIIVKNILSTRDYSALYNAYQGTAFGLSHTILQTAMLRPASKSKKVKNLYYTGQYVHPGIGMPMCLVSAELTAAQIINESNI